MIFQNRYSQFQKCPFLSGHKCDGDTCAAWRWFEAEHEPLLIEHTNQQATHEPDVRPADVPQGYEFWPHDPKEGTDACWFEPDKEAQLRRRGYCGACGKPEFEE